VTILSHARTDTGRRRKSNEDSLFIDPALRLYVIADGMGGHAAGEVASKLAVESIHQFIQWTKDGGAFSWPYGFDASVSYQGNRLRTAILYANRKIIDAAKTRKECRGMATTVVAVLMDGDVANVVHAGDSRAYLIRDTVLMPLTSDHSWVEEQVEKGDLSAAEAREHPWRTMVTRALGGKTELTVDLRRKQMKDGDTLLLCTDGLTSMLPEADIASLIGAANGNIEDATAALVAEANTRGGTDNITVMILRFQQEATSAPREGP
jgi:serine/threonine protein phosphatase PrpC